MTGTMAFPATKFIKYYNHVHLIMRFFFALILLMFYVRPSDAVISANTVNVHEPKYFRMYSGAMHKDNNGQFNVFYGGNHLYRAIFDGSQWNSEIIDGSPRVGLYATATKDKDGNFFILYRDEYNKNVKLATNETGVWSYESLNWYQIDFNFPESIGGIAVDSNGAVHIVSSSGNYATNVTGIWKIETLEQLPSSKRYKSVSIIIDSTDMPHLVFSPAKAPITGQVYELVHAYKALDGWSYETIDTGSSVFDFTFNSILLDDLNKLHVAYSGPFDNDLYYATNKTGAWVKEVIEDNGPSEIIQTPTMLMKKNGDIGIIYLSNKQGGSLKPNDLRYAENSTGNWVIQIIETTNVDTLFASALYDINDDVNTIFFDVSDLTLKHYTLSINRNVDSSEEDRFPQEWPDVKKVGMYPEVVIDGNGFSHVCYLGAEFFGTNTDKGGYDVTLGELIYATNTSGKWVWVELTKFSQGQVARCNITVDSVGFVHIAYESNSLKYVSNKTGQWVTEEFIFENTTIRSEQHRLDIRVDALGDVHLAYMDLFGGDVRYGSNSTGVWEFETADSVGDEFGSGSDYSVYMSVGITGDIHIAYMDRNSNLTYTSKISDVWSTEIIAYSDPSLPWVRKDIELDKNGVMHMVYSSLSCSGLFCFPGPLMYGSNISGEWTLEAIDDDVFFIQRENLTFEQKSKIAPSISIINNFVNVGYFTGYSDNESPEKGYIHLYYAYKKGSLWRKNVADSVSNMGWYTAISNVDDKNAHVVFYDAGNESLKISNISLVDGPMIDLSYINLSNPPEIEAGSVDVVIKNIGQNNLDIYSLEILNDATSEFALDFGGAQSSCKTTPIQLMPDSECAFSLIFSPATDGQKNIVLSIKSNDPDFNILNVDFVGKATTTGGAASTGGDTSTGGGSGGFSMYSFFYLIALISLLRRVNFH